MRLAELKTVSHRYAARVRRLVRDPTHTLHRVLAQSDRSLPWFSGSRRHLFVVGALNNITWSMIYPFYRHAGRRDALRCSARADRGPEGADRVFLFSRYEDDVERDVELLRRRHPDAILVFMDWTAPLDLRFAERIGSAVDVYVKKHWARSERDAVGPFAGDTNLMSWFGPRYGLDHARQRWRLPEGFGEKARVFPGFFTAERLFDASTRDEPPCLGEGEIDLHAVLTSSGTDWYELMRRESQRAVESLQCTVHTARAAPHVFQRQMQRSKLCFSPFGYGEVSWRDYEAVLFGTLLIKPDMSHIASDPDIYEAHETYVPIAWDLSDLEEKIEHYAARADERARICRNAFHRIRAYHRDRRFEADWMRGDGVPAASIGAYVGEPPT